MSNGSELKCIDSFSVVNIDTTDEFSTKSENLPEELQELKRVRLLNRLFYLSASILLLVISFISALALPNIKHLMSLVFVCVFSAIMFIFEIGISCLTKLIAINFGFMYNIIGRVLFTIILIALLLSISNNPVIIVTASYLVFVLLVFIVTSLWHPSYESFVRKEHYYAWEQGRWFV